MANPPRPPAGTDISFNFGGDTICVQPNLKIWRTPVKGATVHTIDNTGKRVTLTRVATLGFFALAAKKKSGELTVIVVGADGDSITVKVKAKKAEAVTAWAIAFNAWSTANG